MGEPNHLKNQSNKHYTLQIQVHILKIEMVDASNVINNVTLLQHIQKNGLLKYFPH